MSTRNRLWLRTQSSSTTSPPPPPPPSPAQQLNSTMEWIPCKLHWQVGNELRDFKFFFKNGFLFCEHNLTQQFNTTTSLCGIDFFMGRWINKLFCIWAHEVRLCHSSLIYPKWDFPLDHISYKFILCKYMSTWYYVYKEKGGEN